MNQNDQSIYIETLGCSKNINDTEIMLGLLDDAGYSLSETPEKADILVVNTCSFIYDAQEESMAVISYFSELKKEVPSRKLLVTGCLSQAYPEDLLDLFPAIDATVGTSSFFRISDILAYLQEEQPKEGIQIIEDIDQYIPENLPRILTTPAHYAYLKIAEGCDNRCTYCLIPALRGKYRSRPMKDILSEAEDLVAMGVRELIVIAQDTSRYGIDLYGKPVLGDLLQALSELPSLRWIRVHYLYPDLLEDSLIEWICRNEKIVNYFDIPFQHTSDAILRRMNRKTNKQSLAHLVQQIRSQCPESVIRSTVIVGFPGEQADDFNELVTSVTQWTIDRLGAFPYSNLHEVPASRLPHHVPEQIKMSRLDQLMTTQQNISEERMTRWIGKMVDAVIEECLAEPLTYVGRTRYDSPDVDGVVYITSKVPLTVGDFVYITITDSMEYDLIGEYHEHCK